MRAHRSGVPRWLSPSPSIPSAPSNLFEYDLPVDAILLPSGAATFQCAHDESSRFRRRDPREAGNGGGQISHNMANRQGAVLEQNTRKMMLGQQARSDGPCRVHIGQAIQTTADDSPMVRKVLGIGVVEGILQVQIRIDMHRGGRGWRGARSTTSIALGRNGRGDGIGRSW